LQERHKMKHITVLASLLILSACTGVSDENAPQTQDSRVEDSNIRSAKTVLGDRASEAKSLIETALAGTQGYDITESLTTEVGQRLAGTEEEARARDWAVAKFKEIGLENVRIEPFTIPGWERGQETASILSPYPQDLVITSLGYSVATPPNGVEAEIAYFPDFESLKANDQDLSGKIVFISGLMDKAPDGAGYGPAGMKRRIGASEASKHGAHSRVDPVCWYKLAPLSAYRRHALPP